MATVTGLTAARMAEIEAASIVDAELSGTDLVLTKHDGTPINVGPVVGPPGPDTEAAIAPLEQHLNSLAFNVKDAKFGPSVLYVHGAIANNASHPLSNYFADLPAAQAVYPHATALTDELDWAACQKAQDTGKAAGGVCVWHPRGNYRMGDKTYIGRNYCRSLGEGYGNTQLWWADRGLGKLAVDTEVGGQNLSHQFDFMSFVGPRAGVLPTVGVRSCGMDGVKLRSWCSMGLSQVSGFGSNIVLTGNHHKLYRNRSTRGFFNILFGDTSEDATLGDQQFEGNTFDWCAWSSVGIYGNSAIVDSMWSSTHLGFGPYGVYKFDVIDPADGLPKKAADVAGAVASTWGGLVSVIFDKIAFEAIGNACILDESTGAGQGSGTLLNSTLSRCSHTWTAAHKIASRPRDYAIHARVSRGSRIDQNGTYFGPGDIAAFHIGTGGITVEGGAFEKMFSPTSYLVEGLHVRNESYSGHVLKSTVAVNMGDILEKSLNGYEVTRYSGAHNGRPIAGVAAHNCAAGSMVLVIDRGVALILSETVSYGGVYLVPNGGGVYHRAQGIIGWGMSNFAHEPSLNPAFAISLTSGGAVGGGFIRAMLLPAGGKDEPGYIRPQAVTSLPAASSTWRGVILRVQGAAGVADTCHVCIYDGATFVWKLVTLT